MPKKGKKLIMEVPEGQGLPHEEESTLEVAEWGKATLDGKVP